MSRLQLAFYRGPATDVLHRIGHWGTCLWTNSEFSHVELVIDGVCHSSSSRDGGVRAKRIDLDSGRWVVVDLPGGNANAAGAWFALRDGDGYDWPGIARFPFPFLPHAQRQWFCSEAVAAALFLPEPESWTPQDLYLLATNLQRYAALAFPA